MSNTKTPTYLLQVAVFYCVRTFYIKSSREVKRLEALSRSPIYAQLSESIGGLMTLRVFGAGERSQAVFQRKLDTNVEGFFAFVCSSRWLGCRLDLINFTFLVIVVWSSMCVSCVQ